MKLLEDKIRAEGKVLPGDVLRIDNFLNHQIDVRLLEQMGREFYELFKDNNPNKILTIEASGIAVAIEAAKYFGYIPVVFAKKAASSNMSNEIYVEQEHSYTKNVEFNVQVAKEYLNENDRILILDDFLANGEAMNALIKICHQAKATVVGCGAVVSKSYQKGEQRIRDMGIDLKVLASVKCMSDDGQIEFN